MAKESGNRFGIQGFPTLKFFRGDVESVTEYNGPREADGIVQWIKKKAGPATLTLASAEDATAFAGKNEVGIIGFFAAGSAGEKAFQSASSQSEDVPFALTSSDEVRAKFGVAAGTDAIVQINTWTGEEPQVTFSGEFTAESINAWVDAHSMPSVVAFSPESASKIFRGTVKTHFLVFADDKDAGYDAIVADFRAVAKANAGKALFVTVDPTQDRVVSYFGVTTADMPTAVIVTMPENEPMKKFIYDKGSKGALTKESMGTFIEDYTAGKLSPFLKSEPVPESNDGPVAVVVGKNFEQIVMDTSKDVLLEFYAPWCGHCKSLAPEWEKLGQRFKSAGAAASSIVIAKMDATANEVDYPGVNVRGFPTILLFPATRDGQRKTPIEFDGSRDANGFVEFLRKNAAMPFKLGEEEAEL